MPNCRSARSKPHPQPETATQHPDIPATPPRTRRCRHIFTAGHQCGSPCLRSEQFCYYHHTTRRPIPDPKTRIARVSTYHLPIPEDRDSIRAALAQVMHDIANNHIDLRRAGLILYSLQIALCALPPERSRERSPERSSESSKESRMSQTQPSQTVNLSAAARRSSRRNSKPVSHIPVPLPESPLIDTVLDDTHGLIAPETFLEPETEEEEEESSDGWVDPGDTVLEGGRLLRNTLGYKLLKEVELCESRSQGWHRGRVDALNEAAKTAAAQTALGVTPAELTRTLTWASAKAIKEEAAFSAQLAAGMAKSPFYTGKDPDDEDDAESEGTSTPLLEPWESPTCPT